MVFWFNQSSSAIGEHSNASGRTSTFTVQVLASTQTGLATTVWCRTDGPTYGSSSKAYWVVATAMEYTSSLSSGRQPDVERCCIYCQPGQARWKWGALFTCHVIIHMPQAQQDKHVCSVLLISCILGALWWDHALGYPHVFNCRGLYPVPCFDTKNLFQLLMDSFAYIARIKY